MVSCVGEAPGKVILIGEHAVVYGHPAIAIPLRSVRAHASVECVRGAGIDFNAPDLPEHIAAEQTPSPRLAPLVRLAGSVLDLFGERDTGLRIELRSTIPLGRGLGSGAAVSVALVRGICLALGRKLNAEQVCELADEAEKEFHSTPSGIDSAVVARDEPVYFVKEKGVRRIEVGSSLFHFLVADTGISAPTGDIVREVRVAREKDRALYDSYFWEIGSLASVSREILRTGSPPELGLCMNRAHRALQSVGVSSTELDHLVATALEHGALGAKLSGAGRGGVMLALLRDPSEESNLTTELMKAGATRVYATDLARN